LDLELRGQIKQAIISTLASPVALVRAQTANLVAAIASIEIPRKEWNDLIPNLSQNSSHPDFHIRLASLTTLGYICEEIEPGDLGDQPHVKNGLILALINNISADKPPQNLELCKVAIKALLHSIPFAAQNFKI